MQRSTLVALNLGQRSTLVVLNLGPDRPEVLGRYIRQASIRQHVVRVWTEALRRWSHPTLVSPFEILRVATPDDVARFNPVLPQEA